MTRFRCCTLVAMWWMITACSGGASDVLDFGDTADIEGSCEGVELGALSPDGCACDDDCVARGDCCGDKIAIHGQPLTFTTYNTGLVDAVGLVEQRRPQLIDAIREEPSDVLCLQEVWNDQDVATLRDELAEVYPYSFDYRTEDDGSSWFSCTLEVFDVWAMDDCRKDKCTDISSFECIDDYALCRSQWEDLSSDCQLCLSANTESPVSSCVLWNGDEFANDGRNGLMLFSKFPIEDARFTEFDTHLIKRGVINAEIAGTQVQCTHMTPELDRIPYPSNDNQFSSWADEHLAQVDLMASASESQCTVLLGDLNTGPESDSVDGEMEKNFEAILERGYQGGWQSPPCTHCAENPMVGGEHSSRIDHVLLRGCPDSWTWDYARIHNQAITVRSDEGHTLESRLSDHYGVSAFVTIAPTR